MRSASTASTGRPLRSSSAARCRPTMRGSSHAAPYSATRPSRLNAEMNRADGDAKHTSPVSAMTNPRPAAAPLTAMTTGIPTSSAPVGSSSQAVSETNPSRASGPWASTERSAPEQKPRPAPVTTATRTFGSASASRRARAYAEPISEVIALRRSGRFSVMRATRSRTSMSTQSLSVEESTMCLACQVPREMMATRRGRSP